MFKLIWPFYLLAALPFSWAIDTGRHRPNFNCINHGNRRLVCDVIGDDVISPFTCQVCPHFHVNQSENTTCPENSVTSRCPASLDQCVYDCGQHGYCREGHLLKVTFKGRHGRTFTICTIIDAHKYVKPGPVEKLTLTLVDPVTVKVKWSKPSDMRNEDDKYKYKILCQAGATVPYKIIHSRDPHIDALCRYKQPMSQYGVTVRARPLRDGYWGEARTARLEGTFQILLQPNGQQQTNKSPGYMNSSGAPGEDLADEGGSGLTPFVVFLIMALCVAISGCMYYIRYRTVVSWSRRERCL